MFLIDRDRPRPRLRLDGLEDLRPVHPHRRLGVVRPQLLRALEDLLGPLGVAPPEEDLTQEAEHRGIPRRDAAGRDEHRLRVAQLVGRRIEAAYREEDGPVGRVLLGRELPDLFHERLPRRRGRVADCVAEGDGPGRVRLRFPPSRKVINRVGHARKLRGDRRARMVLVGGRVGGSLVPRGESSYRVDARYEKIAGRRFGVGGGAPEKG